MKSRENKNSDDDDEFEPVNISDDCIIGRRKLNSLHYEHIFARSNTVQYEKLAAKARNISPQNSDSSKPDEFDDDDAFMEIQEPESPVHPKKPDTIVIDDSDDETYIEKPPENAVSERKSSYDSLEAVFEEPTVMDTPAERPQGNFTLDFSGLDQSDQSGASDDGSNSPIITSNFSQRAPPSSSKVDDEFDEPLPGEAGDDEFDEPLPGEVADQFNTGIIDMTAEESSESPQIKRRRNSNLLDNEADCTRDFSDDDFEDSVSGMWIQK